MADQINDGGPAFPTTPENRQHGCYDQTSGHGMTLRDYFAAHAPPPPSGWRGGDRSPDDLVAWSWYYAALMLKTRPA